MCADDDEDAEDRVVAIREGMRSANATRGYGSIAIEVNDERVAP
jgi:hypothetical protein